MLFLQEDFIELAEELPEALEPTIFELGGYGPMSIVTLLLILLLLAAWKAPAWVKEIGLISLALGLLWATIGVIRHGDIMHSFDEEFDFISPNIVWYGLKCNLIPTAYCFIVYIVSLIIRVVRKPRK